MTPRMILLCLVAAALRAEDPVGFQASELSWAGAYADRASEPRVVYSLVGRSQYGSPQAAETGQAVKDWLAAHPSARVITVWSFTPPAPPKGGPIKAVDRQVWAWVVDGEANLVVDLVAKGCWPAGVMAVPNGQEPLVSKEAYDAFLADVREAERAAKAARLGIWGRPDLDEIETLGRADRLRDERRFAEAAEAYREAIQAGADAEMCWLSIAECRDAMGEYQAALAAYDEAIATGGVVAVGARASCMSRYEGPAAAAAWIQGRIDDAPASGDKAFLWSVLGLFHMEEDRPREALEPLRKAFRIRCDERALRFDERDELVVDEPTAMKPADDFLAAAVAIESLARCALKAGEHEEAFRVATRGVSIGRQIRRCEGRYAADEVEAGDAFCRAVRAAVLARRGQLREAREEQRHAALLAERSGLVSDREAAEMAHRVILAAIEGERRREGKGEEERK